MGTAEEMGKECADNSSGKKFSPPAGTASPDSVTALYRLPAFASDPGYYCAAVSAKPGVDA